MKGRTKEISLFVVLILVLSVCITTMKTFAVAITNSITVSFRDGYTSEQGKVQYSLDDGNTWVDVTTNISNRAINVTGNNLRVRIVPNNGYRVDFTGIEYNGHCLNDNENAPIAGGITSNNGYFVDENDEAVELRNVEFRDENNEPGGNGGGPQVIDGGTQVTGHFNYNNGGDGDPVDIWLNGTEIGVGQPPAETCDYYYVEGSGKVTFDFATLIDNRMSSLVINGTDYSNKIPTTTQGWLDINQGQIYMLSVEVPYSETYNITTTTTKIFDWPMGNFLWSYKAEDAGADDYIGNGKLEFVSIVYNGHTYSKDEMAALNKPYLDWDEGEDVGGAVLPAGALLTVSLLPDSGYQLTSFTINGGVFEAGETKGTYTFEVPRGNFHLGAHFTAVDNKVDSSQSDAIASGSIQLSGNESGITSGTARLDVKDIELSAEQISNFKANASDYDIKTYLDISLFNTIFKGSENETWDTQIDELDGSALVTLKLANGIDGRNVVIVHEKHDGTYEIIETTYDEATNSITFRVSSFSNYAIASKTSEISNEESSKTTDTKSSNPKTGDNIMKVLSVFVIATFGTIITLKRIKGSKVRKH